MTNQGSEVDQAKVSDEQAPQPPARGFRAWLKHAFAVEAYDESVLGAEEKQAIERLAARIHEKGLTSAAILWVQSNRHFNWVSSQFMVMFQPIFEMTHPVLNSILRNFGLAIPPQEYPKLVSAFEKRYSIEYFVQRLEALAAGKCEPPAGGKQAGDAAVL